MGRREKPIEIDTLSMRQLIEFDACTRCGECINLCPTYSVSEEDEAITPRGKIQRFKDLVRSQYGLKARIFGPKPISHEEMVKISEELYMCSTCGQCKVVCPSKIETVDLWETGLRRLLVKEGVGPLEAHDPLIKSINNYDNPWMQPRTARDKWAKPLQKEAKKAKLPNPVKNFAKEGGEILYFVGCTASYDVNLKQVAINTSEILNKAAVDFGIFGTKEKCCGSTLLRMGDWEGFERLAKDNIELFKEHNVRTIITSCAGCFKTIKEDYALVEKLDIRVMHTVELLEELIRDGRLKLTKPLEMKLTYHDPCHLGRHTGVYDAPRNVLGMVPGFEFVEMERNKENSYCCGAGGGQKTAFSDVVQKISKVRVEMAEATGASVIAHGCPFCYQGLEAAVKSKGSGIKNMDITEIVNISATKEEILD